MLGNQPLGSSKLIDYFIVKPFLVLEENLISVLAD
jgi:hypothetical protein